MNTEIFSYPSFKVDDNVKAWERCLSRAISGINPLYFRNNPRFKGLGDVSAPVLVDYMGIYDEGDWRVLTVVEVKDINENRMCLFLPFVARIFDASETNINRKLPPGLESIAFELVTDSPLHGLRKWKIMDAFTDAEFLGKILNLFIVISGSDERELNAYIVNHESGIGRFIFHSLHDIQSRWHAGLKASVELTDSGDTLVRYGRSLQLIFNRVLPNADAHSETQLPPNLLGQISYSGKEGRKLLIAIMAE